MNKQNKQCKIIQDLLPTYVENLTADETNEYIEEHLEKCPECMQVLKDMQGDIQLEKIDKNIEIKGLKKVKRKIRIQIFLWIIFVVGIFSLCIYINNNYSIYRNEEGKISIKSYNPKVKVSNSKYLVIKAKKEREGTKDGYIYITQILTLDEEDKCTNMRYIEDGYINDRLQSVYYNFKNNEDLKVRTNIEIKDEKIYYNVNSYNMKYKNEIITEMKNYYDEIEYIYEI